MRLTEFCGEVIFDSQKTFNTTNPRLSNCFIEIVIDIIPCFYLWIIALPYYLYLRKFNGHYIEISTIFKWKAIGIIWLWMQEWILMFYKIGLMVNGSVVYPVDIVSPLLVGISMALVFFFLNYERMKGVRSSGYLTIFWLLYVVLWILPFKQNVEVLLETEVKMVRDTMYCILFFVSYAVVVMNFISCFFLDSAPVFSGKRTRSAKDCFNMDKNEDVPIVESPELSACFLSIITFWWFNSMVILGFKQPLETKDLWSLKKQDEAGTIVTRFLKNWEKDKAAASTKECKDSAKAPGEEDQVLIRQPGAQEKKDPSLLWTMCKTFGPYFMLASLFKLLQDCLSFVSPQLLRSLIKFTSDQTAPMWQGYALVVTMFITALIQSVFLHQYFHICYVVGMRLRSAILSAIYRKSLLLSNEARRSSTVGEVVNLMSVDAQRFMELMTYISIIWSGPFQIIVALYFLWNVLGPSVLAGLSVMILLIPINACIASKTRVLQVKQMKHKDNRIKMFNEILNGIKVLKLYAWETSFQKKVLGIRADELKVLRSAAYLIAASTFTWVCAPFLVSLTTFAVYVLVDENNVLDAEKAFVSLSLFNILRFPLSMLPMVISSVVQASVSLKRLNKFMNNKELDVDCVNHDYLEGPCMVMRNGSFKWERSGKEILNDINLEVEEGSLVAVVGQVGCGKSSLLSALLGDMDKVSGDVKVKGSIAYVAQQAWIQNATLRDNVLFGRSFDRSKYFEIINLCELKKDLAVLPSADKTEIGEKGINLSGGQKQRVAISRAVYQDAQIYLLDDPLSAVDAHVGKNIFENVIGPNGCLKNKTRILVTHSVSFLPQMDKIIVLKKGKITEVGHYDELLEKGQAFAEFLRTYSQLEGEEEEIDDRATSVFSGSPVCSLQEEALLHYDSCDDLNDARSQVFMNSNNHVNNVKCMTSKSQMLIHKSMENIIEKEIAETGNVKLSVYFSYGRSIGLWLCIIIILFFAMQNVAQIFANVWLSAWSNDPVINGTQRNTDHRLAVYGAMGAAQGLFALLSSISLYLGTLKAAQVLHDSMLANIVRVPMKFFDRTPIGRIINRFSKDVDVIDNLLVRTLSMWLSCMLRVVSAIVVISYSTAWFLVAFLPLMVLYYLIQRFYVATSRQLKRLESISRSPIHSHFGETITGASTIRAYGRQERFILENEHRVDLNQMAYYPNIVSNRWLAIRLEFVGNCIVLFAAVFAVVGKETINPGIVGLSISYALQITQTLNWMVRQTSELETNIVAVERVKEYSEIEEEAPAVIQGSRPLDDWPQQGAISFIDYSTRYRKDLDLVVKNISIEIQGGEKVGIVGRTGAGKSSLTLALFRVIESAEGKICIDGVNIAELGLEDLRSRISIIPQDPALFSGPLRMNLDPFDIYSDEKIWDTLEHAHLKEFVSSLPDKLEYEISEGGENLSVGQRQLVCLARALLRHSKILVLDEATAAVDLVTDDLIQNTIRVEFSNCTTFTIAHRLNTIMDSTRVLVLDAGKVIEFDEPDNLLRAKGVFYSMAKDAGLVA